MKKNLIRLLLSELRIKGKNIHSFKMLKNLLQMDVNQLSFLIKTYS
jgi:hypothetical protein